MFFHENHDNFSPRKFGAIIWKKNTVYPSMTAVFFSLKIDHVTFYNKILALEKLGDIWYYLIIFSERMQIDTCFVCRGDRNTLSFSYRPLAVVAPLCMGH